MYLAADDQIVPMYVCFMMLPAVLLLQNDFRSMQRQTSRPATGEPQVIWRLAGVRTAFSTPPLPLLNNHLIMPLSFADFLLFDPAHDFHFRWQPVGAAQFQDFTLDVCARLEQAFTHDLPKLDMPEKLWYVAMYALTFAGTPT